MSVAGRASHARTAYILLQKLKDLKKTRRKQRKELEALMGLRQEKLREPEVRGVTTRQTINIRTPPRTLKLDQPDIVNSSELVREALRESMQSFQETLDKYKEEEEALSNLDLISTSTPTNKAKFSTFPRGPASLGSPEEPPGLTKLSRQLSNSSISSVSTVSSAALHYPLTPEAYLASLPSSVSAKQEEMDTNSIGSISSEMSTNTLRTVREQMARSLVKLKEYEKQVEAIPMLQVKLSVLKEEKRLLMLRLKAREAKLRRDRGEPGYESDGAFDSQVTKNCNINIGITQCVIFSFHIADAFCAFHILHISKPTNQSTINTNKFFIPTGI